MRYQEASHALHMRYMSACVELKYYCDFAVNYLMLALWNYMFFLLSDGSVNGDNRVKLLLVKEYACCCIQEKLFAATFTEISLINLM